MMPVTRRGFMAGVVALFAAAARPALAGPQGVYPPGYVPPRAPTEEEIRRSNAVAEAAARSAVISWDGTYFASGVLVDERTVMTAGHVARGQLIEIHKPWRGEGKAPEVAPSTQARLLAYNKELDICFYELLSPDVVKGWGLRPVRDWHGPWDGNEYQKNRALLYFGAPASLSNRLNEDRFSYHGFVEHMTVSGERGVPLALSCKSAVTGYAPPGYSGGGVFDPDTGALVGIMSVGRTDGTPVALITPSFALLPGYLAVRPEVAAGRPDLAAMAATDKGLEPVCERPLNPALQLRRRFFPDNKK